MAVGYGTDAGKDCWLVKNQVDVSDFTWKLINWAQAWLGLFQVNDLPV